MEQKYFYILPMLSLLLACQHAPQNGGLVKDTTKSEKSEFRINTSVDSIIIHYWDSFDFSDINTVSQPDNGEQALVNFINLFPKSTSRTIAVGIDSLLMKSSVDPEVQLYFERLISRYLYDVNSPFYNESYYIIALEKFIASSHISETKKIRYRKLLELANQNNIGDIATDFTFFSDKTTQTLHSLKSNYLILFFYVPQC